MAVSVKILTSIAFAALLTAPAAAWSTFGSVEPSTHYDRDRWMWPEPGGVNEKKVFFNVLSGSHYPPASQYGKPYANPNVGLLETQIEPFGSEYHVAFFGVWIDCNGDGYLGSAEGALREYDADLLLDDSACPLVSGSPNKWEPGAHNYNGWVSEFIPIIRGTNLSTDARVYRDDDARVWGDFHRPDERPFHRSCALNPQPRGTWQSTGGVVNYVDCRVDLMGPANDAFALVGDPLGWSFSDEDDARTSPLGRIDTLGPEDEGNSPATYWDCDAPPAFHSGSTYNSTPLAGVQPIPTGFSNYAVMGIEPKLGNTQDPSVPGLINHTIEGAVVLQNFLNPDEEFDCDSSNDFGHDTYGLLEADFNGVNPNNKLEADWNFNTVTHARGQLPLNLLPGGSGPAGIPFDGGIGIGGTRWVSDSTWLSKTGPRSLRVDLQNGGFEIAPAYWLSFYASVGEATASRHLQFPPAGPGTYGSWHCGDNTSGIHSGWNCDAALWYQNPDGSFPNNVVNLAKPGWAYHVRDVDCYDGRIGDTGIGIQPAFYGPSPCS